VGRLSDSSGLVVVGILGTLIAGGLLAAILYFNGLGVYGNISITPVVNSFLEAAGIFVLIAVVGIIILIAGRR